jgi:ribosomal protein L19E
MPTTIDSRTVDRESYHILYREACGNLVTVDEICLSHTIMD